MRLSETELKQEFKTLRMLMSSSRFWDVPEEVRMVIINEVSNAYMTADVPETHVPSIALEYCSVIDEYTEASKLIHFKGDLN